VEWLLLKRPWVTRADFVAHNRSVLLITSNGWGLGHLIRQLTVQRYLPSDVACSILTLSQGAHVAAGDSVEYAPSYTQPWLTKAQWHGGYLRDRIVALAREVDADVVVFDGVVPYVGLIDALRCLDVTSIWMRRGMWRSDADTRPLRDGVHFDHILEPADVGSTHDSGATHTRHDSTKVKVITDADPETALSRSDAATSLGVDPDRKVLLINVGSSALADISVLDEISEEFPEWQFVTTKDSLGRTKPLKRITQTLPVFPLHPYLQAVDLAITSVGYNAAHEFIGMGVPTIFVPAPTTTDDQYSRAAAIEFQGLGWAVTSDDAADLERIVRRALSHDVERLEIRQRCLTVSRSWHHGGQAAADFIIDAQPSPHSDGLATLRNRVRVVAENLVGNLARRQTPPKHVGVLFSESLTKENLGSVIPFEHIKPHSSAAYAESRRQIAARWFGAAAITLEKS
jgi:hypothetical protein